MLMILFEKDYCPGFNDYNYIFKLGPHFDFNCMVSLIMSLRIYKIH